MDASLNRLKTREIPPVPQNILDSFEDHRTTLIPFEERSRALVEPAFRKENGVRAEILNSVYQTSGLFREKVKAVPVSGRFYSLMEERLASLLDELADTAVPFRRTEDAGMCEYCDFRKICGR